MSKEPSAKSMRDEIRNWSRKSGERYMDLLGVNRKAYLKLQQEGSAAAEDLSRQYLSSREQDGTEIAGHHKRRLDRLRSLPRTDYGLPSPEGDFTWPDDRLPDRPPDERPFDELPEFPSALDLICHYSAVTTLDTAARHTHDTLSNGVATPADFTDDLAEGVNLCMPAIAITSLSSASVTDPMLRGFTSFFRFNFTPPATETYRFKPAAFVNGFAYTLEVGGILGGVHVPPTWSTSIRLVLRVSQFESGFYRLIEREILQVDQTGRHSNVVSYDSTSDARAAIEGTLEANHRVHVVVGLRVDLSTVNSFPSARFDGLEQYFKVPEVYVDRLVCRRLGRALPRP